MFGCIKEVIGFIEKVKEFKKVNIMIIGVFKDIVVKYDKFKVKYDLGVILVFDEIIEIVEKYGVWVEKNMYGRKFMGIERLIFFIDEKGVIRVIWCKVKVLGYVDVVLEVVGEF